MGMKDKIQRYLYHIKCWWSIFYLNLYSVKMKLNILTLKMFLQNQNRNLINGY